jgi:membrane-associated phospholipid phosphatase
MYGKGPYVFKPFAFGDWAMRSFPGGHGANAMACATSLNYRFDLGVVEPVLSVLSVAIGFGRVLDGAHWTSDTAFALVFGWAVGRGRRQVPRAE